ncbi:hypothetical protein LSAT2_019594 [Lamellibrachia satsuma]|nr:hypothetical protein LSAT2_019594 [Lamellibrachia satsuma]
MRITATSRDVTCSSATSATPQTQSNKPARHGGRSRNLTHLTGFFVIAQHQRSRTIRLPGHIHSAFVVGEVDGLLEAPGNTAADIAVCFDCDYKCKKLIHTVVGMDVPEYFDSLLSDVEKIYRNSDIAISFLVRRIKLLRHNVHLRQYLSRDHAGAYRRKSKMTLFSSVTSLDLLMNYWTNRRLSTTRDSCDVAFLITRDPVFAKLGLCGIARLNSICTSYARGIIEIPVSRDLMTLRVAHEIGHILGMYHYNVLHIATKSHPMAIKHL